ncbi:MAG: DUF934 domain-containing protein [Rhizobiaceae bacterium]|nr:DUF934 domain-containing protein [Rhizobiaceae bacterium]MCV0407275.1 DUF934 domain-containing protein [Rhizobiaceae bacterium]
MTTDTTEKPLTRLWTCDGFQIDGWRYTDSIDGLAGNEGSILPLEAFLSLTQEMRARHANRIGVLLQPADALEAIVPFLSDLAVVALAFPAFGDGRSYSKAALLRTRHSYGGTVRATGDVLIDQIPLMLRAGFDAFEVSNPTALARLEEGRLGGLPLHYQPSNDASEVGERYSWRRMSSRPAA